MRILFTGGGTGGHIFPILAVIRELRRITTNNKQEQAGNSSLELYFAGPKSEIGLRLLKKEGVVIKTILAGKIRRYFTPRSIVQNIIDILFKIPVGCLQSFFFLRAIQPDIIFSKGGYGALPINWAAQCLKIPIFLHESDIVLGKATRISYKSAKKIFTSFERTEISNLPTQKIFCAGNPVRKEILHGSREEAVKIFGLTNEKPIILILGGSQGAQRINELALMMLPDLLKNFEIIHQCGEKNLNEIYSTAQIMVKEEGLIKYYHNVGFLNENELKHAYAVCHLVISRAGSGAIFEIAAVGKPSILLPLPKSAQNHQAKNASAYAATGAAIIIESKNLTPSLIVAKIMSLFSDAEKLKAMSQSALAFAKPDAAKTIAVSLLSNKN